MLAEHLWPNAELAGAYNFGPPAQEATTVRDVIEMACKAYGNGAVQYEDGNQGPHEAGLLALEITKAHRILGFKPRMIPADAIRLTMGWYRYQHSGFDRAPATWRRPRLPVSPFLLR